MTKEENMFKIRDAIYYDYAVFVLNLCLRTNKNSAINIINKLTARDRNVFITKYKKSANCNASNKKRNA